MNNIEAEIADLTAKIAEKRKQLEAGRGVVEEREVVKAVLGEQISKAVPQTTTTSVTPIVSVTSISPSSSSKSYLDSLDSESRATIDQLVESVYVNGLDKTLKNLDMQEPFIIDTFHDVLTDKLYVDLKKRGLI